MKKTTPSNLSIHSFTAFSASLNFITLCVASFSIMSISAGTASSLYAASAGHSMNHFTEAKSESTVLGSDRPESYGGSVQLSPVTGFSYLDSKTGVNLGGRLGLRMVNNYPLYFDPGFDVAMYSGQTRFGFDVGLRYDVDVDQAAVKPFVRVGLGPTFQTSGTTTVFSSSVGGGLFIPINDHIEARAELGVVTVDGMAGMQLLVGASL